MQDMRTLYRLRFSPSERAAKDRVWAVLCEDFFSRFVTPDDRVLDVAAGYCEFINHIRCKEKWAIDMNPDARQFANSNVRVVLGSCLDMSSLPTEYFDVAFVSNFFEHLDTKNEIDRVLQQINSALRRGGKLLVLQPNIRYLGARYWDFYDHLIPLTHLSLGEALAKNGFVIKLLIPKFLPYTFKSRIPKVPALVRAYLRFLPAQWVLGKQTFALAIRCDNAILVS